KIMGHEATIHHVGFSMDDRFILTGSDDGTAQLWEADSGQPVGESLEHADSVHCTAFTLDGTGFITCAGDQVYLWEIPRRNRPAEVRLPEFAEGRDYPAAFSPNRRVLLTRKSTSGKEESAGEAWLCEVATGKPIGAPIKHQRPIRTVA